MRFKRFLFLTCISLLVAAILIISLAPLIVTAALRLWIARTAQQDGLRINVEKIDAPLLRPVVIQKLEVVSQADAPFHVSISSPRVEISLSFAAFFNRSRGRLFRSLTIDEINIEIRRNPQATPSSAPFGWHSIENLLSDNFRLAGIELHIQNGETVLDLHNGTISGSQMEAGTFNASDITIESPWFRKSFPQLRGVTSWQDSQLTIGAVGLTRGLDLDALTIDLSHVADSRLGFEVALDAFGGKLRARVSSEDHGDKRLWDAAGNASEISLAQMSDALDLTDRASGSLHACKFTFRGEAANLREATAAIWAEVTGLTWRDRTADTIMIGASLYNHQVQVEQLFVKQRNNQFTLTGESALGEKWSDWLNPDFRGDISASIKDLGDFARFFGAKASDFAGQIDISGSINARERKFGGQLSASGNSLVLFKVPVESLKVDLSLKESRVEVTELELLRGGDSFHGQASFDLAGDRNYSFNFTSSMGDVADYTVLVSPLVSGFKFGGGIDLNWAGQGTAAAHSGTFHAWARNFRLLDSPIAPFDAEIEGDYSPDNTFFRQFNLSNQYAALGAFVTVGKDYVQLQSLHFDLNGKQRLQGDLFLPVSLAKLQASGSWLAALNENPVFDVAVALDSVDLAELCVAISGQPKMSGQAFGSLEWYGPATALEGKTQIHLRDFVLENEPSIFFDLETRAGLGILTARSTLISRGSNPVSLEGSIPLMLEKQNGSYVPNTEGSVSAILNFPAVLLSSLPRYISRAMLVDGLLTGRLVISDSLGHPQIRGFTHVIDARSLGGPSLSSAITFGGQTATIDFVQLVQKNLRIPAHPGIATPPTYVAHGEIDFRTLRGIEFRLWPNEPVAVLPIPEPDDCISGIELLPTSTAGLLRQQRIDEIDFGGSLLAPGWTISFRESHSEDPLETLLRGGSSQTYRLCSDLQPAGNRTTLAIHQLSFP